MAAASSPLRRSLSCRPSTYVPPSVPIAITPANSRRRTFSEWSESVYAEAEIDTGGRFGGNRTAVSTCQDCHMADTSGVACAPGLGGVERDDLPRHGFAGANSWVLEAVRASYPDSETGLDDEIVAAALARNVEFLQLAADLEAFLRGGELVVRVTNRTGHKLPTGYGEGRRMWINVQFLDATGLVIAERGAYDPVTAVLDGSDTRVYEVLHGIDEAMSDLTGLPVGKSFHFVLNNTIEKDNRVPPRGYESAAFAAVGAPVVGHAYAEQVYWDDVAYTIPPGAATARVRLYHQTTSKEYIEFLRDANVTDDTGQEAYDLWASLGRSAPVAMAGAELDPADPPCPQPLPYGLGVENSEGRRATLGWEGEPSNSGDGFRVVVSGGVPEAPGAILVGTGSDSREVPPGTLLVADAIRGPSFTLDAAGEASVPVPLGGGEVGAEIWVQAIYQDPAGRGRTLSEALHFDVCE